MLTVKNIHVNKDLSNMDYRFLSPEDYLKKEMKRDKQDAIMQISDYLQYDLAPKDLEWVAKALSYAYLNELPEAQSIFKQIKIEDKHFFAIEDDLEQYEELIIKELENGYDRDDPREYYQECYGN